ncbi:hypothetical protein EJV47_24415 [Hymenobacter gummosus]|uniref:Uncharacterized protein n=1 Tax=Hymenobacter gummosus TaxID=1776032 RepID=A0A431TVZ8_9BACT|nr:hypothetical protein [Hymenobacter gummosus]RTQ45636.1 hypothetical protein EJV47_24415 [Hymenobacter gummosus]
MQPEDIDKLFRAKLEQHATPPPPSLWYDLQEQLEPEEKKRRGGFFWMAVAAAVTLLLVAGGGWLVWQNPQLGQGAGQGTLASGSTTTRPSQATNPATVPATTPEAAANGAGFGSATAGNPADIAARTDAATTAEEAPADAAKKIEKTAVAQATVAPRTPSTHQQQHLLARTSPRAAARPEPARTETPDFRPAPQASVVERQALAAQPVTAPAPTTNAALAPNTPAVATAPTMGAIEVEVRQQPDNVAALAAAPAADETPGRTRPSVRGVLRQVRRLAQGEKPDLTEVGLPANPALTVQARVAGHTLTKTISL